MAGGWRIPEPPLRQGAIRALTLGAATVVVAATLGRSMLHAGSAYPLRSVLVFVAIMLVAIGHLQASHPFRHLGAANAITTARAAIAALVAGLLGDALSPAAMTAMVAAGLFAAVLDGVDGQVARRTGMASLFGARFDMETDAFFILVLSAAVWRSGKAGVWILLAGLMRYLFVAAMALLTWMRRQEPPSVRRKAICVVQVLGLSLVMLPVMTPPWSVWWSAAVLLALIYSFGIDTLWLWRHRD